MDASICETCGKEILLGSWPFCPHELVQSVMITEDEIPGGMWLENYGPKPIKVYSHSERLRIMKAGGLEPLEKFCPFPGTDKDPQGIQNPAGYVDDYTMKAREALFLRAHNSSRQEKEFDGVESGVLKDFFNLEATERDAIAVATGDPKRSSRVHRRITNGSR
jgi:hypothetical protein